jgi:hypothetical protein
MREKEHEQVAMREHEDRVDGGRQDRVSAVRAHLLEQRRDGEREHVGAGGGAAQPRQQLLLLAELQLSRRLLVTLRETNLACLQRSLRPRHGQQKRPRGIRPRRHARRTQYTR